MNATRFAQGAVWCQVLAVTGSDAATPVEIQYGGGQSFLLLNILGASDDTIDHIVELWGNVGGADVLIGSCTLPAGRGSDGTASVDIASLCLPASMDALFGDGLSRIKVRLPIDVTAGKTVYFHSFTLAT